MEARDLEGINAAADRLNNEYGGVEREVGSA